MKVSWGVDLKIEMGNSFDIDIGKWEIALKIVKWNAVEVLLSALSLFYFYIPMIPTFEKTL